MFAIAPTDINWFEQIRSDGLNGNVIKFWTPTPWNVKTLKEGDRLYFMLKSPIRKIGGYGKFLQYKNMKANDAWSLYGRDNGVENLTQLISRTSAYIKKNTDHEIIDNPEIGCILLKEPIFFEDDEFMTEKDFGVSFPTQVVKLKYFKSKEKLSFKKIPIKDFKLILSKNIKKRISSQKERKGQARFRREVLSAYQNLCAISSTGLKEVLEAAHIQQYISEESNNIQNGICLRADLHKMLDNGLLSINSEYEVKISSLVKDELYLSLNDRKIRFFILHK